MHVVHLFVLTSHTGREALPPLPAQFALSVHSTHWPESAPVSAHCVSPGLVQSVVSEDAAQARHLPKLTSQIGFEATVQSAFEAHSPHTPFVHCERQSSDGTVHAAPSFKPQRLSVTSHTPLSHTRAPFETVHVPEIGALEGSA